nr:MAG TPA: hypothetical protein [Caudoviricetes sp.]
MNHVVCITNKSYKTISYKALTNNNTLQLIRRLYYKLGKKSSSFC